MYEVCFSMHDYGRTMGGVDGVLPPACLHQVLQRAILCAFVVACPYKLSVFLPYCTTNPMCTLISASSALLSINSGLCHPNLHRYEVVCGFPAQLSPQLSCHGGIFCWSCHRNQQRNSRELDTDCHYWDIPVYIPCGPGRFTYTCLIP